MHRIHLNIGSNRGDRRAIIGRAVALLAKQFPGARLLLSDYVESAPWGYESPNPFLNRGVLMLTPEDPLDPLQVLDRTQRVEALGGGADNAHRDADGNYTDRRLDIDIIDMDSLHLDTPRLQLPHPRMHLRSFVLQPLHQLNTLYPPEG